MKNKSNIFTYSDYRKYVKDYFLRQKTQTNGFSHRSFATELGLSTTNFMLLVMQGKRNISPSTCFKLSEVMGHNKCEAEYFGNMVNYGQAKKPKEKDVYYSRMVTLRKEMNVEKLEDSQYQYYSEWYNPVVREVIIQEGFDGDFKKLGNRLSPAISHKEAAKSVKLLLKLGLIKKKGNQYVQSSPFITTGDEVSSVGVANFHRKMAHLAAEAIDSYPRDKRNITSCTVRISNETYEKMIEEIAEFRKKLLCIVGRDENPDRVYQVNFQAFPVTKQPKAGNS
jgi:uncharacterized protein (TIGR02147 family)